jgi:ribonuclease BN (tRNA processing enzyme)
MLRLCSLTLLTCPLFAATQLVLLGTGTPRQDPQRYGPASAVIFNSSAYLFDAGVGVVRHAAAAADLHNIPALRAPQLRRVFITHLHSDHTLGLPDLIFSPWTVGRTEPLEIWGPKGTQAMVNNIEAAWSADVDIRIHGLEHGNQTGYRTIVHEIDPGFVYRDAALTITAIPVHHGSWPQAYGYRIQTPDRVIVLSGDCSPSPALIEACNGCDVLVHEVYTLSGADQRGPGWIKYLSEFHTSVDELAVLAKKAHPKLLVLYHQLFSPGAPDADALIKDMKRVYTDPVVSGSDLDLY